MWWFEITLSHILDRKGISNRELARRTGIRPATINSLCNNTAKQLSFDNLATICEVLDIDLDEIILLHKEEKRD
ncbi:helix-turn-helix transcriptional regulator [Paenibacillus sp. CMAA1739]|uniref:helix-turn-helix domain-containing protein n=1 Tax=Paenibacillus TaxID=44249 RepID=UPI0007AB6C92|nr:MULTISPECIES: helix-turn-helix transcriptional regulator [Paenibacillus]KAF6620498.1 helix-turn-helix transcriptional regulator [Paenibacillus sp. EKM101P]KAF6623490.1 helix-turn-helix transcriptional regulator [Paenibacillus sp. EKM102P]KAF6633947.1 helix-turn-helix transcriptional regulator [Paenibacillus sp. EKM10P]KAF6649474.1 helix-turn-helix transcriptional regulator [Paenibacillus sp. EKM11P]KZE65099.1 hypothetical protein AV545_04030 [Paenibacillus jamilae]